LKTFKKFVTPRQRHEIFGDVTENNLVFDINLPLLSRSLGRIAVRIRSLDLSRTFLLVRSMLLAGAWPQPFWGRTPVRPVVSRIYSAPATCAAWQATAQHATKRKTHKRHTHSNTAPLFPELQKLPRLQGNTFAAPSRLPYRFALRRAPPRTAAL
jgi:hypothetical protein